MRLYASRTRLGLGLLLTVAALLPDTLVLAQQASLDLGENTPIFRRGSARRTTVSTTQSESVPQLQTSTSIRRSTPASPSFQAPPASKAAELRNSVETRTHSTPVDKKAAGGDEAAGAVESAPAPEAASVRLAAMSPGSRNHPGPKVTPLLPLPNWEGSDLPSVLVDPTPAPNPARSEPPPAPSVNYVLSPSDYVQILVFQENDLATETRISQDGTINFPLIGITKIGGKTANEAVNLIRARLDADYVVNPQVTITVMQYSRARFTILGEVAQPGTYDIPREETITLLDAIASAGGFTRTARTTAITVKRSVDGTERIHKVDAKQMARDKIAPFKILPGDTITVPVTFF